MTLMNWILVGILSAAPAFAQWETMKSNIPRTADGKPNLAAPVPRTREGKPDLSGIWWLPVKPAPGAGFAVPPKYLFNMAADIKPEELPLQPWAAELFKQRRATSSAGFPGARCLPGGPMSWSFPVPWKIVQTPDLVVILYETHLSYRQIFMDGRVLSKDADPNFMGYSVGHWEGDTL